MKQLIYKFRQMNIKKQFLILLLASFCIMMALSILILFQARQAIIQTSSEYSAMLSSTFASEIRSVSDQATAICEQIQYDTYSTAFLQAEEWHAITAENIKELIHQKSSIQEINKSVADIAYVSNIVSWSNLYTREQLADMTAAMTDITRPVSLGIYQGGLPSYRDIPFLVFGCPIYADYQPSGYVFISINLSDLTLPFIRQNEANVLFFLADRRFNTFAFNCEPALAENIFQSVNLKHSLFTDDNRISVDTTISHYAISADYVTNTDCYIISAVNIEGTTAKLKSINVLCWTIVTMTFLLLTLLYFILYRNYVVPIRSFNHVIEQTEKKQLRTLKEPLVLQGCEEIRQIGNSFTSLLNSINELNHKIIRTANDLYEMELQKKIAELSYLRSQINPHFIYNTLELIRDIADEHAVPRLSGIAVSMGKIMRYNIKGNETVPLQQEIDISLAYIKIQQARFHDRITVFPNFQQNTLQVPVIKMLLQPLIENAIFHGIEPMEGTGILYLGSIIEQDKLIITIRDNGTGIPPGKLGEIQDALSSPFYDTGRHVGLVNTNARIRLQYGVQYGISVESTEDDGCCIVMTLPAASG